jgi:hypothetical protein
MHNQPRFGGLNPLKLIAVLGGIAIGGVVAAAVVFILTLVLTFGSVSASGLLTYGWIIAAYLIYRAIRSHQKSEEYGYEYEDDDDDDERERRLEHAWQREWAKQAAQAQAAPAAAPQPPQPRQDTRPAEQTQRSIGTATVAVVGGSLLALGANLGLSRLNLPPTASTLLPALAGAGVGVGIYAMLSRFVMPPVDDDKPPTRAVREQLGRIKRKAKSLAREASASGVYSDLHYQADRLCKEALALGERLFELRRVAREARREFGNPARPDGIPHDVDGPQALAALQAAQEAQKRLDELLARNRDGQHQCVAEIERIEDVIDVARLEIACPPGASTTDRAPERIVQEVETELEAAKRALAEVQRESQLQ